MKIIKQITIMALLATSLQQLEAMQQEAKTTAATLAQENADNLLRKAVESLKPEDVAKTLKNNADPNTQLTLWPGPGAWFQGKSIKGSVLMYATRSNDIETVKLLLQTPGIQVNAQNILGLTALHYVIRDLSRNPKYTNQETKLALLKLFLQTPGINLNIQDNRGISPLLALRTRDPFCVPDIPFAILLMEHGADPYLKDRSNTNFYETFTAADLNYHTNIMARFEDIYATYSAPKIISELASTTTFSAPLVRLVTAYLVGAPNLPAQSAKQPETQERKRAAAESAAAPKILEKTEANHLILKAIDAGIWADAEFALQQGADVNARGTYHNTPLITAAIQGEINIVRQLLAVKGIAVNQPNAGGRTALIETIVNNKQSLENKLAIIRLLLNEGADVTIRDGDKLNAYDCADKVPEIRQLLENYQNQSAHTAR